MMQIFDNLKGTYDYIGYSQLVREHVKKTLQGIFVKYGFAPVETPILCKKDLLTSKYSDGADILKEMYMLSDQGKRELGLRYDLTITFSKLISSNKDILLPYKRYEIGKVFRDGPVKLGRNREFTQCDVDCVGTKSVMAEAEYMSMTEECYREIGLDIEILYNNRKIMSGIIKSVLGELDTDTLRSVIMIIDKFEKLTENELIEEFRSIGILENKFYELKDMLNSNYKTLKGKLSKYSINDELEEGFKEIDELNQYLENSEAIKKMTFAPYLARGIDIYTGIVWEVVLRERKVCDTYFPLSIGGGGRYDRIITSFIADGKEYPAVGMSFGLDVIYEILMIKNKGLRKSNVNLFVIPLGTNIIAFKFAEKLRKYGVSVDVEKNPIKLKKSMTYANKMNIPFTVVIGENESESNRIILRDMNKSINYDFELNNYKEIAEFIFNEINEEQSEE